MYTGHMSNPPTVTYSIEEDQSSIKAYHRIHATGCKDLRDGEVLGEATSIEGLLEVVQDYCDEADDVDALMRIMSPCAKKLLKG